MHDQESSRTVHRKVERHRASMQKGPADTASQEQPYDCEQRFRALFEQAVVGILYVGSDGRIQHANRRFCDMLGYGEEEVVRLSLQDLSYAGEESKGLLDPT